MTHILGRIDLRGAQLEQLPDGFIIHENGSDKVLCDVSIHKATLGPLRAITGL